MSAEEPDSPEAPRTPRSVPRLLRPLQEFLATEVSGAALVLVAAVLALVWANLSPLGYETFWGKHVAVAFGDPPFLDLSLRHWINDVAMTLFFFVVGLEIKREVTTGELREPRAVALPVLAAIGGMVVPALVYLAWNAGGAGVRGWGIPMATDIAFAIAVLTIAGRGLPSRLRAFLLTLAIADDIGAILVIAVFYSAGVALGWLGAAAGALVAVILLTRLPGRWRLLCVLPGAIVWYAIFRAGIHPTIAGVILGLAAPAGASLPRLEHRLHPWSSYVVVPLFALANAGVVFRIGGDTLGSPIFLGVLFGLVVGKLVGVAGATFLGARMKLAPLPASPSAVIGVAVVAGIGFTVSLFVTELAFDDSGATRSAKAGVLVASLVAGGVGSWLLHRARREPEGAGSDGPSG